MIESSIVEVVGSLIFSIAILHTFLVKKFQSLALKYTEGSIQENFFHLLGEIEIVFGLWAAIFIAFYSMVVGYENAVLYIESLNFTEPVFVFVIMALCSTKPILFTANSIIEFFSKLLPLKRQAAFYTACMIIGPLSGSLITEPAAMTVTALILLDRLYKRGISSKFMYASLGLLFVNVSIGGTLTPYAAPPVLMVASKWNWDFLFMLSNFGWKAALAILVSTLTVVFRFRKELFELHIDKHHNTAKPVPYWVVIAHLIFLVGIILTAHHMTVFLGLFLFFLGLVKVTQEYQDDLKIREALLVGFFLAGLVVLGGPQRWWLEPLLVKLDTLSLFLGSIALTAITDNAALTYLGSLVPTLSDPAKYALVAGAVTGGGLTVIANAPNPAGYGILNSSFGEQGISPLKLFTHALFPTLIAAICFWVF